MSAPIEVGLFINAAVGLFSLLLFIVGRYIGDCALANKNLIMKKRIEHLNDMDDMLKEFGKLLERFTIAICFVLFALLGLSVTFVIAVGAIIMKVIYLFG